LKYDKSASERIRMGEGKKTKWGIVDCLGNEVKIIEVEKLLLLKSVWGTILIIPVFFTFLMFVNKDTDNWRCKYG
jgi:hypothetical protein